jgi:hypothetical protein
MICVVRAKPGVLFTTIAPGGFAILRAVALTAQWSGVDLTITSACDGDHSGPDDPHHRGEAFDVRSHDLPNKKQILARIMDGLGMDRFFGQIEDEGGPNEHIHIQVKKGVPYP